jgi:hypothetical protein
LKVFQGHRGIRFVETARLVAGEIEEVFEERLLEYHLVAENWEFEANLEGV